MSNSEITVVNVLISPTADKSYRTAYSQNIIQISLKALLRNCTFCINNTVRSRFNGVEIV